MNRNLKWLVLMLVLVSVKILQAQEQDSTYFWNLYEKGRFQCQASDFYNARVILENALSELRESDYKDFELEARILTDIAWAYTGLKDNVTENIYIEAALQIYAQNLSLTSEEYATALHDMALTQGERKNYTYAIELLDSSNLVFQKHIPDFYPAGRVSNLVALGWIYREQGKYDEAISALKEAVKFVKLEGGDHYTDMGTVQHILGYTLMYHGNLKEALIHLLEGKKIRSEILGPSHPIYYQSHQKIAECYSYLGEHDKAQLHLDTIIRSLHSHLEGTSDSDIQVDSIKSWNTLLQTYVSKGNVYLYKYQADLKVDNLDENFFWFKKAIDAIQKLLLYYPTKEGRFQLLNSYSFLFDNCVNQAVLLYDHHLDPKYLEQAFQISELSRGFTSLEALHKAKATENYNVPKALLDEEANLTIKMQKFEMGNEKDFQNSRDWISMNLELQKVQQKIKRNYPNYFDLKSNLIVPSIKEIQQRLDDSTAIVEYFEGYQKVFEFVITKDTATVRTVNVSTNYNPLLTRLIRTISKNPIIHNTSLSSIKEDSEQLYDWLISPIDTFIEGKKSLVIIPHKKLNYLPFEILHQYDSSSTESNYLIHDFIISYDYSCTSLFAKGKKASGYKYAYQGIAPGIRKHNLPDESINEIKQAHDILGGKYSINHNANRKNLFSGLKKANIVHIAAHSILDTSDLSKFAIVLNHLKIKNKRDSILIEDIYLSDINSELIILSGCQTADGVLKEGEGLLSLTNAFKYAGAKSLTCSLWETENKVGNTLITKYISNLQKGQSKALALQKAKLDFLESSDPLLKHPFYWSTFVNVGNQEAVTISKNPFFNFTKTLSILLAIIILGFIFFMLIMRNNQNIG